MPQGSFLVTINYRCGVFGFFSSKELSEEQGGTSETAVSLIRCSAALGV
jgi:carboxylesterase type B